MWTSHDSGTLVLSREVCTTVITVMYLVVIFNNFIHFLPSLLLEGGFRVAQFVRMDLDPSHWPFISAMAFSASTFLVKETKP